MTLPTKERLARAMEAENTAAHMRGVGDAIPERLIRQAREGRWDDYESPLMTPMIALVTLLRATGNEAFAERVIAGEFDGSLEEGRRWIERETGEVSEIADVLGLRGTKEPRR